MGNTVSCSYYDTAGNGDTCGSVEAAWGLNDSFFSSLNPGVQCPTLTVGSSYCVYGSVVSYTPPPTSSTTPLSVTVKPTPTTLSTTTTTTTTSAFPYSPTQPGLASNCDAFYFVQPGDTCAEIDQKYQISFDEFYAWNPAVGSDCVSMWASAFVCVGTPGATTVASTPSPTPTTVGPQPQMPGVTTNCKNYYYVNKGDNCYTIEQAYGISLSQLLSWNTGIDSNCDNLWADAYICVSA